jgi:phosphoribosylamine-glycine ligase
LKLEGLLYCGVLYFGLMMTEQGPKVLEFNVRFGDPESQVLLPVIDSDFCDLTEAMINRELNHFPIRLSDRSAVGVVVASKGYPNSYEKGIVVDPLPDSSDEEVIIFHASTRVDSTGKVLTGGGRCFTVVGMGDDPQSASRKAYSAVKTVCFAGAWYRSDIGKKFYSDKKR